MAESSQPGSSRAGEGGRVRGATRHGEIVRLEALGRRAWPALAVEEQAGWLVGTSGADTRRANSASPIADDPRPVEERIRRVEDFYARHGRAAVFKMTEAALPSNLDRALASRGYRRVSESLVMTLDLEAESRSEARDPRITLETDRIEPSWFDASVEFSEVSEDRRADYLAILEKILETTDAALFGRLDRERGAESVALGCVTGEAVSLLRVATAQASRGQRLAEAVIREILTSALGRGASLGLLAVEEENDSARRLYDRLGFVERYRYWYRVKPARKSS